MRIYFTESQVPEVRPLPVCVRRLTILRALETMRCEKRLFYWLPTLLAYKVPKTTSAVDGLVSDPLPLAAILGIVLGVAFEYFLEKRRKSK